MASKLRSGIYLQQYAQNNPLAEYVEQATKLFNKTKINIANEVVTKLSQVVIRSVESEEKPTPITITDDDIIHILKDVGLTKVDLNHKRLAEHFAELKNQNQNDTTKLRLLQRQFDILDGLVFELERRQQQQSSTQTIEVGTEEIKAMAKVFGIKDVDSMTEKDVVNGYEKIKTTIPNPEPDLVNQVEIARQVLIKLAQELALLRLKENQKVSQPQSNESDEYIIETENDGKKRRIRRGQDMELEMSLEEGESTKRTKIG